VGKSWALDDREQLHKDADALLQQNLMPGEPVLAIVRGSYDSAAVATDRRIFVFKKGLFSGAAMAKKLISWDYRNVTGVQVETGMISGAFVIQAAGAQATDASFWGGGNNDAMKATNAVALARDHFDQAKAGAALIRELISKSHDSAAAPVAAPAAPDITDQIRKLGELRDAGILTAEEFDSKKGELLARM
jgi:hypothetical protein